MAAITAQNLEFIRRYCLANSATQNPNWTKPQINAAANAIDAWFDLAATRTAISNAIDVATSPKVFTAAEKKLIMRAWLTEKFGVGT